jgi:hypothetical protein
MKLSVLSPVGDKYHNSTFVPTTWAPEREPLKSNFCFGSVSICITSYYGLLEVEATFIGKYLSTGFWSITGKITRGPASPALL